MLTTQYHVSRVYLYCFPSADPMLQLVYIFFWGATVLGTLGYVYSHGKEFTDVPKLVQKDLKDR